ERTGAAARRQCERYEGRESSEVSRNGCRWHRGRAGVGFRAPMLVLNPLGHNRHESCDDVSGTGAGARARLAESRRRTTAQGSSTAYQSRLAAATDRTNETTA